MLHWLDMWLIFTLASAFCLALVNYIDEHLTANNKVPDAAGSHAKIGGLLLISTLLNVAGAFVIWTFAPSVHLGDAALYIALLSAIPMVITWAAYFYLLLAYPAYQVVPVFLFSSAWLLVIELMFGTSLTAGGLAGILVLIVGSYLLDVGRFAWQIPTRLFLIGLPVAAAPAAMLYMVRVAAAGNSAVAVAFWQMVAITLIGIVLFASVRSYRFGFLYRLRHQGGMFLGFSALNESFAQAGYFFGNLAVAAAPVATYVTALGGTQGVFLLGLLLLFPMAQRKTVVSVVQVFAVTLIACGVFLVERFG